MGKIRTLTLSILREDAKDFHAEKKLTLPNLRRIVMRSKIGNETVKASLRQIMCESGITSSKYKKRTFKEVIKSLEEKKLIKVSNDIDNDSIVILNVSETNKDITAKPNDVTLLLFYAYCPSPMTRGKLTIIYPHNQLISYNCKQRSMIKL